MKIAIIGANGQLGSDVCRSFRANGDEVIELDHEAIEVSDFDSVSRTLRAVSPQVIVNTAAFHHVQKCEADPAQAFAVNAIGPRNLALMASEIGAVLIHVSTDYVFDGSKRSPYVESDRTSPLNVYGNSKLAGEYFALTLHDKAFVLRTSGLYGKNPCRAKGLNFVERMLKLARERDELRVVDDEKISPTWTAELAKQIVRISRTDQFGLYHATAEGACSWYEFAGEIFRLANTRVKLSVASPDEFSSKVPRPKYSVLENSRLKSSNLNLFRPWQASLTDYLNGS